MFYIRAAMNNSKTEAVNVRIAVDLKERAAAIAQANGISLSDMFRMSLLSELADIERGRFRLRDAIRK